LLFYPYCIFALQLPKLGTTLQSETKFLLCLNFLHVPLKPTNKMQYLLMSLSLSSIDYDYFVESLDELTDARQQLFN